MAHDSSEEYVIEMVARIGREREGVGSVSSERLVGLNS